MDNKGNTFSANYNKKAGRSIKTTNQMKQEYASWADAWAIFKQSYENGAYRVHFFDVPSEYGVKKMPYYVDENMGILVGIELSLNGVDYFPPILLPVLDAKKKSMKVKPYNYLVKDKNGKPEEKKVEAVDMADINRATMRCLVKAIAIITGIGLEFWSKEDNLQLDPDITVEEMKELNERIAHMGLSLNALIKATSKNMNKPALRLEDFTESMYRFLSHQLDLMEENPDKIDACLKKKVAKNAGRQEEFTMPEFVASNM